MARNTPNWTPEEDEWLRESYPTHSNRELAEFKALDGWPRDAASICRRARTLGVRKAPGFGHIQPRTFWCGEREEWFRAFSAGHSWRECSDEHERLFGTPLTRAQVKGARKVLGVPCGVNSGCFRRGHAPANKGKTWDEMGISEEKRERIRRTQFRRGYLPYNTGELLDERHMRETWQVKVDPRDATHPTYYWIQRAHFNWERANARPWPDGHKALHLDRDAENDDADNILPVPNDLWPLVMGAVPGQLEWYDRESAEAAVAYARLTRARVDTERRLRIAEGRPRRGDVA